MPCLQCFDTVGWQEGHPDCKKNWVVGCWRGYLSAARCRYGPADAKPLTVSCFSKIQIGFTFLVPAHPGSPGQRAVKRGRVYCHYCTQQVGDLAIGAATADNYLLTHRSLWTVRREPRLHRVEHSATHHCLVSTHTQTHHCNYRDVLETRSRRIWTYSSLNEALTDYSLPPVICHAEVNKCTLHSHFLMSE